MKCKKIILIITLLIISISSTFSFADNENITLSSDAAVLIDASSGRVLYDKNMSEKKYPASTTKILTAILAIENCELSDIATVSYNAVSSVPSGYSTASLQVGEELTIEQLLNVLLIHSANEAGFVLAEHIGGSVSSFSTMMNTKAIEIGCTNTHFTNPSGIFDEEHYSTAYDLALITQYCMKNETFRNIVSKTSCTIPATNKYDKRTYTNTNELLINNKNNSSNYYEYAIGIKTGYTSGSKHCLISASLKDGLELICVILGANGTSNGLSPRAQDSKTLYEYAYNNYSLKNIVSKDSKITETKISNGTNDTKNLDLLLENDITALVENSENLDNISPEITIYDNLLAPISSGSVVGYVKYTIDGIEYKENLVASHDVMKSNTGLKIFWFLFLLIILYLLSRLLDNNRNKNKKNSRKRNRRTKRK